MAPKALPGFRDFFPEEFALRAHIFDAMRRVARRYAFEEYDGPPLETLELYTAKSGDEIVGQLYNFRDKGDREVALRPEMTPTLARMVAERANGLKKPIRWFSIPQLFRYERQQRGRLREHFQLNCDIVGEAGPLADAEIVALAIDVMRALGLTAADVRVRISDRRLIAVLLEEIGVGVARQAQAFEVLDKVGRSEYGGRRKALAEAGASEESIAALESLAQVRTLADIEAQFPNASQAAQTLRETLDALESMGLGEFVDLDLTIVRGLAYYTGTVFELFDAQRTLRAICGGGRYDNLLDQVGGVSLPALGFGMGDVVLGELLKERQLLPRPAASADIFVVGATREDRPQVLALGHTLREHGFRAEYALGDSKVGKQLELAGARGSKFAVVVGPDERARNAVVLKDLGQRSQREVPLAELLSELAIDLKGMKAHGGH